MYLNICYIYLSSRYKKEGTSVRPFSSHIKGSCLVSLALQCMENQLSITARVSSDRRGEMALMTYTPLWGKKCSGGFSLQFLSVLHPSRNSCRYAVSQSKLKLF